ncbi:MAG: DUF2971 domain-containing protein [candidate division Zixibacteria bacterium]|nr:DUF2971 domain-containing protein [candidate division Zixibacteria bacterium]
MFNRDIPDYIYKYISWDNKFHKRILTHSELYFSQPKSFNDPFDCLIEPDYSTLNDEQVKNRIKYHVKRDNPSANRKEVRRLVKKVMSEKNWKDEENIERSNQWSYKYKNEKLGINCFSGNYQEILMWSYYACGHRGLCLKFSTKELESNFKTLQISEGKIHEIIPVEYVPEIPKINPIVEGNYYVPKILSLKSNLWKHEDEYRILFHGYKNQDKTLDKDDRVYKFTSSVLKGVYFGYYMEEDVKKKILTILKNRNFDLELYNVMVNKEKFELLVEPGAPTL